MEETFVSLSSLVGVELQHRREKAGEGVGLPRGPAVLVCQDTFQTPRLQLGDVLQLSAPREPVLAVTASSYQPQQERC